MTKISIEESVGKTVSVFRHRTRTLSDESVFVTPEQIGGTAMKSRRLTIEEASTLVIFTDDTYVEL